MPQFDTKGLSSEEALALLARYGKNELPQQNKEGFIKKAVKVILEPMFMLLIAAAVIYFLLGEPKDGSIMLLFVAGVISIDIIQEWKTDRTLAALKDLSAPLASVTRDGEQKHVPSAELVPGDLLLIQEGGKIPADGFVIKCSDLCVDESSLTGESLGVWKRPAEDGPGEGNIPSEGYWRKDYCYAGTLVIQGTGTVLIDKTGAETEYGKIGVDIAAAYDLPTPLQKQTARLVKLCAVFAAALCAMVTIATYMNITAPDQSDRLIQSVLSGVTIAMAMIPEEFPVILTVFLSLGAWRLAKKNSLVRRLPAVETLGAVTVLCVDKTGTITMNKMTVTDIWPADGDREKLCETMGLACETDAYDPMEKAMISYCERMGIGKDHLFGGELLSEYSFTNELKMMGHVWKHDGEFIIAAKGSPEKILSISALSDPRKAEIQGRIREMSERGLRVIAVGKMKVAGESEIPAEITDLSLTFLGLVGLTDPPRESIKEDIATCTRAGVRVVMITGDNGMTAKSIAREIGMPESGSIITGEMLESFSDEELCRRVMNTNIFSRVIPEHKMRIVKALKANGEIVAMTGDGVNDAPALKYADIGIAMGKRGSEVAREAADLILMDDNFSTIVETIEDGRRIYDNIRKAVGYVFTIHIPIAAAALLAPLMNISPADVLFLPLHVVLMELIIDPTCSIVLERQPAESDIMDRPPRSLREGILTLRALLKSVIQGVVISFASFGTYSAVMGAGGGAPLARAMGLSIIMLANLFLVLVNSSESDSVFQSFGRLSGDNVMKAVLLGTIGGLIAILYSPLSEVLRLAPLCALQFMEVAAISAISVFWYEAVKLIKSGRSKAGAKDMISKSLRPKKDE